MKIIIRKGIKDLHPILIHISEFIREIVSKGFYHKKECRWVDDLQKDYVISIKIKSREKK